MRVLYVEDNEVNQALVARVMRARHCEVIFREEGEGALEVLADDPHIDLILMDIELAGLISGLDVVRTLRARNDHRPVVAITAYAMMGDRERILEAGCDQYLPKPLVISDLLNLLDEYEQQLSQKSDEAAPAPVAEPVTAAPAAAPAAQSSGATPPASAEATSPTPAPTAAPAASDAAEKPAETPAEQPTEKSAAKPAEKPAATAAAASPVPDTPPSELVTPPAAASTSSSTPAPADTAAPSTGSAEPTAPSEASSAVSAGAASEQTGEGT